MKRDLAFDFSVEKDNNTIRIKKGFAASESQVWRAWTAKEFLDQWWGPKPWHVETKTLDFIPNGIWHYAMVGPEGEKHWNISQYISIDEGESYTLKDGFCDENGVIDTSFPQSTWEVSFNAEEGQTIVDCKIQWDKQEELETILQMGFKEGITQCLNQLDELLEQKNTQDTQ